MNQETIQQIIDLNDVLKIVLILETLVIAMFVTYFFVRWQHGRIDNDNRIIADEEIMRWWNELSYKESRKLLNKYGYPATTGVSASTNIIIKIYFSEFNKKD